MSITVGTVFSGIGAIEQALLKKSIKHKILFACDNGERNLDIKYEEILNAVNELTEDDKQDYIANLYLAKGINQKKLSYIANYDIKDLNWYEDIRYLNGNLYKNKIDLFVGGSPCQSFSINGRRGGFEDTRGTLFYDFARLIQEINPKVFIYENVAGMLTHDNCRTWETVKNVFYSLNYDIYIKKENDIESPLLNSCDFGIPQNRERLFVIGISKGVQHKDFNFPMPIPLKTTVENYYVNRVPSKYYLGQKGFEFVTTHPSRARVGAMIMGCQKANQQFNWNGDFIFVPIKKVRKNKSVMAKAFVGQWNKRKGVIRKYTPRECLRLMGFPDSFKIVVNDTEMYRQAGNSIVVNVLEAILEEIFNTGVFNND